jgi:hypothetical protein
MLESRRRTNLRASNGLLQAQHYLFLLSSLDSEGPLMGHLNTNVTCTPISRQRPKYAHAILERGFQEVFSIWSAPCPLLGNGSITLSRGNGYTDNNRITPVAMQRAVNTTIEEKVFSISFAYIHCWATDVFSVVLLRDYICSVVLNQKSVVEGERERSESLKEWIWVTVIKRDCTRRC